MKCPQAGCDSTSVRKVSEMEVDSGTERTLWECRVCQKQFIVLHVTLAEEATVSQYETVLALRNDGWTMERIAGMMGCSRQRVWQILKGGR